MAKSRFQNKVALITGAAGGVGQSLVQLFSKEGAKLILPDLSSTYINAQPNAEQARQVLKNLHPLKRIGQPSDAGDLAVYLASDTAKFLTGQIITIDGGRMTQIPLPF